jgi:hypothetical protein
MQRTATLFALFLDPLRVTHGKGVSRSGTTAAQARYGLALAASEKIFKSRRVA